MNADGCHEPLGHDERAGRFELPGGEPIAHHGIEGELERLQAVEKFLIGRLEQGEVRLVIDHHDVGCSFFARFGTLQLDVILVRHQIGRDKDVIVRQNRAECALGEGRLLLPRSKIIERLSGYVDPD